jgi:hypothetical protein
MHVLHLISGKVHYSAVFGLGLEKGEFEELVAGDDDLELVNDEVIMWSRSGCRGKARLDPCVKMRRRISFKSTNLIGSSRGKTRGAENAFQDDVKFTVKRPGPYRWVLHYPIVR